MIVETTRALVKLFKTVELNTHMSVGSIVELAALPAIVLNGPVATEKKRLMRDPERIAAYDYENKAAVTEVPPRWYDLVAFSCKSTLELVDLMERCSRLAQSAKLLKAEPEAWEEGRTREYLWAWQRPPSVYNVPNISEVCEGRGDLIVYDVEVYSGIQETVPLIRSFELEVKADWQNPNG